MKKLKEITSLIAASLNGLMLGLFILYAFNPWSRKDPK